MTKKKKYCAAVLLAFSVGMISQPVLVSAATTADTTQSASMAVKDLDNATPAFHNPADALRAANRAEKAAMSNRDTGGISGAGGMNHRSDQQDTMGSNNSGHRNDSGNDNNNHSGNSGDSNGSGGSSGGGHGGSSGGSGGGGHN